MPNLSVMMWTPQLLAMSHVSVMILYGKRLIMNAINQGGLVCRFDLNGYVSPLISFALKDY